MDQNPSVAQPAPNPPQNNLTASVTQRKKFPTIVKYIALIVMFALIGIGGYVLGVKSSRQSSEKQSEVSQLPSPTPIPTVTPSAENPPFTTTVPSRSAVIGTAPTLIPYSSSWKSYTNSKIGISLKYPSSWKVQDIQGGPAFGLYPPDSDPTLPSPFIAFSWGTKIPPPSNSKPIVVSGITGSITEPTSYAIPDEGSEINIPYQNGTFNISTTVGPDVNLEPQLFEILKTVTFK